MEIHTFVLLRVDVRKPNGCAVGEEGKLVGDGAEVRPAFLLAHLRLPLDGDMHQPAGEALRAPDQLRELLVLDHEGVHTAQVADRPTPIVDLAEACVPSRHVVRRTTVTPRGYANPTSWHADQRPIYAPINS